MNDRRAAERSVEAVVQEREPHVYRPGRKAWAMNDGRVIRQALGDAGRAWVRRALEQGYELSEVARATLRRMTVRSSDPTRQRFESTTSVISRDRSSHRLDRFQRSGPPIRRMPLFNRRETSVGTSVLEAAPTAPGSRRPRSPWRAVRAGPADWTRASRQR